MQAIKLRLANFSDAEMVYEWRNAPETRRYSFSADEIILEEHLSWFKKSLEMDNRCILIAEENEIPVGVLRYDFTDTEAEVGIYVAPHLLGKGFGTKILIAGTDWVKLHRPAIKHLRANVMAENIASARVFDKAGFELKTHAYEKNI